MDLIDVDEIAEVNYVDDNQNSVEIRFKNGTTQTYNGSESPEIFNILNHWTPPTA
jgi:hypothetical protein